MYINGRAIWRSFRSIVLNTCRRSEWAKFFRTRIFVSIMTFPSNNSSCWFRTVMVRRSIWWSALVISVALFCGFLSITSFIVGYLRISIGVRITHGICRDANNYKSNSDKCNFKSMIDRCSKSNMLIGDIWRRHDYLVLNKKLEIAILVSSHVFSLFGLSTHLIVLITILYKKNSEIFKGFKQYSYLCANSVFSLLILLIQILAWTSECFYPLEVFCPEIRKLAFVQVFKMVFKECLVTAFRFMCNFTYVAFALNRISLIGKDHNKLVKFMSDVSIKKYLGVTLFISVGLSVVKMRSTLTSQRLVIRSQMSLICHRYSDSYIERRLYYRQLDLRHI
jgi:hypothetical protein